MAKQIRISAKLDKSGFQKELDKLLKKEYEINLNNNSFKSIINELSKNTEKIKTQLKNVGDRSFDGAIKSAEKSMVVFEKLGETIGNLNEKSQLRIKSDFYTSELKQAQAVNKALEDQYKNQQNLNNLKENLSKKLSLSSSNSLIDDSVIAKLQNRLNSLTTDNSQKEINELKSAINNLSSTEGNIVRVQQAILKIEDKISSLKNTKIDLINSADLSEIKVAENELEKLKATLDSLKSGEVINGKVISNQINNANNSVRTLSNSFSDLNSSGGRLSSTMQEMFAFAIGGTGIYAIIDGFKNASEVVRTLDESMISLKKVTDETDATYNKFLKSMHNVALELGTQSNAMVDATTNWAKTGETLEDAAKLAESTVLLTKVGDIDDVNTAQSYMVGILKSFNIEAEKSITLIDKYNNLSNNMATETRDLGAGMNIAANSLAVAGNSLDEALALMAAGSATTQQSGETIGNALKTISLRISEFKDEDGELIPKLAEDFKRLGVETVDSAGQIRSTFDILKDIGKVYKDLSRNEQLSLSESIGGKHQANIVASILSQVEELERAYDLASDSAGSALQEFETYKQGIQYSVDQLKEQINGLYTTFVNSDFLKGMTDNISGAIGLFNSLTNTLGSFPTTVMVATGAMTIFNKSFRENMQVITSAIPIIGNLQDKYSSYVSNLDKNIVKLKEDINTKKTAISTNIQAGKSTQKLSQEVIGLQTQLTMATVKTTTLKVAMVALQTVASSLISLGISLVISGLSKLIDKAITTKSELKELNEEFANMTNVGDSSELQNLINKYKNLQDSIKNIAPDTEEFANAQDELASITEEICGIFPQASTYIDAETGAKKLNLAETEKLIEAEKTLYEAKANQVMAKNKVHNIDDVKEIAEGYKEAIDSVNKYNEMISNGERSIFKGGTKVNIDGVLGKAIEEVEDYKTKIESLLPALKNLEETNPNLKGSYDLLYEAMYGVKEIAEDLGDTISDIDGGEQSGEIANLSELYESLGYSVDDAKKKIEELNNTSVDGQASQIVADSTEAYNESKNKVQELKETLEELNEEQAVSSKLISELANTYPDIMKLGSSIYDLGSVQEFLNSQIESQAEIQATAYENMIAYDNAYYENKIKNNEEFMAAMNDSINAFVGMNNSGYEIDFNNYSNLNELKNGVLKQFEGLSAESINSIIDMYVKSYTFDGNNFADLQSMKQGYLNKLIPVIANWISTFTGVNADGYTQDLSQFNDLTEMKAYAISQLSAKMAELQSQWWDTIDSYNSAVQEAYSKADEAEALRMESHALRKVESTRRQMNQISAGISTIDKVFGGLQANLNKYEANFTGSNFNAGSVGSSGSNSNKGSSKKDTEKQVADLEDLTDRYYDLEDAITDYSNALSFNKLLQNNAKDKEKINLMKQEIELYKKQADAVKKLNDEQKREASELKSYLSKQGVTFDSSGDISNYNSVMSSWVNWANSLSGEAKENAINSTKALEESLKRYDELVNNLIPKQEQEWQSLQNSISDVNDSIKELYEDQLNLVASQEKEIADMIEYYANKKTEAKKEAVQKELDLEKKRLEGLKKSLSEEKVKDASYVQKCA